MTETEIYEIALSKYPIDEFWIGAGDSSRIYDQNARDRAVFIMGFKEALNVGGVSKRIYLTFADYSCDGAYSTLEKANKRLEQIKAEYPDMEGVYVISRDVE